MLSRILTSMNLADESSTRWRMYNLDSPDDADEDSG